MNRWLKLAFLTVAAVAAFQLLVQGGNSGADAPGDPAPPLALPDLQGRPVDLASLKGRVVAVNFWASWCGPCRAEIPELAEVWTRHRDRCFELLGVAEETAREDALRMSPAMPYPILLDERASALGPWGVQGYPRTVVVDAQGKVRKVWEGAISGRQLEDAIRPLLPATCPARS